MKRAGWIRTHYELNSHHVSPDRVVWVALSYGAKRQLVGRIEGTDRAEVIREARALWGHFNFRDEAEAFFRIFPSNGGWGKTGALTSAALSVAEPDSATATGASFPQRVYVGTGACNAARSNRTTPESLMARETKADLQRRVARLLPYEEAWLCAQNGEKPIKLQSGRFVYLLLGVSRASGGVIWCEDVAGTVEWASNFAARLSAHQDPHIRELAAKVLRAQQDAADEKARYWE